MTQKLPDEVATFIAADDRIERCPPDPTYARLVVEGVLSNECEDALHAAAQGRWRKANTYSYDGVRKSVEAWLLANGWRIRAVAGAHAAVVTVVERWLANTEDPGPRMARSYGASRKARHDDEYPTPTVHPRTNRELRALVLDNARLIQRLRAVLGLPEAPEIVPTEEILSSRPE